MNSAMCAFTPGVAWSTGICIITASSAARMIPMSSGLWLGIYGIPAFARAAGLAPSGQTQNRDQLHADLKLAGFGPWQLCGSPAKLLELHNPSLGAVTDVSHQEWLDGRIVRAHG